MSRSFVRGNDVCHCFSFVYSSPEHSGLITHAAASRTADLAHKILSRSGSVSLSGGKKLNYEIL
jgi:hypothetical protein